MAARAKAEGLTLLYIRVSVGAAFGVGAPRNEKAQPVDLQVRLVDVREVVGVAFDRGRSDDEEEHVLVAVVSQLTRRPRPDGANTAARQDDALGRVTDVHRCRAFEDDVHLLLLALGVPAPLRPRWVAPELRPRVRQPIRDPGERPAAAVAAVDELELARSKDGETHERGCY
jgi:hypothetical protein